MPNYGGPTPYGAFTALNISAATVVKSGAGVPVTCQVISAGSAAGAVHDTASTGSATAANQVAAIPNTVGYVAIQMPCAAGITVVPGGGQVVALSYD